VDYKGREAGVADSSAGAHRSSAISDPWSPAFRVPHERPKLRIKADLLPAISVLPTAGLLGIPLGWLWSRMAPPQRVRVVSSTPGDKPIPLELESWHRFDDLAIYGLLTLGLGIVIGAVVWLLRERRGPVVLIAAAGGAAIASWLGTQVGSALANSRYEVTTAPALGAVLEQAPVLESSCVLLAAPLGTVLVYGVLAAWNGRDDLGRRLG
jgi:hypothetical protein